VLRAIVRTSLFAAAAALLGVAALADAAWFERHVVLPATYLPPPPAWTLPALRLSAVLLAIALAACAWAIKRVTAGGVARGACAVALALAASELALRFLPRHEFRIEAQLGAPDARTGWAFVPRRSLQLREVRYHIDALGDRAPSPDWREDRDAPTAIVAGESIATGHGLQWSETFAAQLGERLGAQAVVVAEGGYGTGQAYLRAADALGRFTHPLALVMTVLPVQLQRNLRDDRPRLILRGGELQLLPARAVDLRLRQLLVNEIPYLSEARLQESLALTRAILEATAASARSRGARPLFVVPSYGPQRPLEAHPEAFIVHALLDGLPHLVVDIDRAHILPFDGHPDAEGAQKLAEATAAALQ
jgi:hypothetical protein